jgi:hypothetical protein
VQILGQQMTTAVFLVKAAGGDYQPGTPPTTQR